VKSVGPPREHFAENLYTGYQGHQPDIKGIINGYQEKIYQISDRFRQNIKKYQLDIPKY